MPVAAAVIGDDGVCQGAAAKRWLAEREAELLPVAQSSQRATWPPSAAVRQRSMA
jgi:hypothetical protein